MFFYLQEQRLRDRQTETEDSLQKRLEAARIDMELSQFLSTGSWTPPSTTAIIQTAWVLPFSGKEPGVFDVVIINDDLERAYEELKDILNEVNQKKP